MHIDEMVRGHGLFLKGIGLSIVAIVIPIFAIGSFNPQNPSANLLLIYVAGAISVLGGVLVLVGIHVFMRGTIGVIQPVSVETSDEPSKPTRRQVSRTPEFEVLRIILLVVVILLVLLA